VNIEVANGSEQEMEIDNEDENWDNFKK